MEIRIRTAQRDDLVLAYKWANDPVALSANVKQGTLPLDTFTRLFAMQLHDRDVHFLIIEGLCDGAWLPVAQVLLHADGIISMSIDKDYRGRRLATPIILAAIEFARDKLPADKLIARIRCENIPSIRAFKGAGFHFESWAIYKGQPCVKYNYALAKVKSHPASSGNSKKAS